MLEQRVVGRAAVVDPGSSRLSLRHTDVSRVQDAIEIEVKCRFVQHWRCHVDRLLKYIETSAGRNKVIRAIEIFTLTGGALLSVVVLTAVYLRDS